MRFETSVSTEFLDLFGPTMALARPPPSGPGWPTPIDAMRYGPREELIYVVCIQTDQEKCDGLATADVDPNSPTYCQVIHFLPTGNIKDELHHTGWNVCSSCYDCVHLKRNRLIMPALGSDRVYVVDTGSQPRAPKMFKVFQSSEMHKLGITTPHTSHCLPSGEIMISIMGDTDGNGKGDFMLIDAKTFKIKGTWAKGPLPNFGYDYWYQPLFNIMVSSEWGAPKYFKPGFDPADLANPEAYGQSIHFWCWREHKLLKSIDLGEDGKVPLEVRFLHEPREPQGYVGCALNANVFRFHLRDGDWVADKCIDVPGKKVTGWISDNLEGFITDIILSLDDKYLYISNWLHGDIRQYNITNRAKPVMTGQVFLGGLILKDSSIHVIEDPELTEQPDPVYVKGVRLQGGPQMIQLSLDGKRLYVTNSLFSPWDRQIYPGMVAQGSTMVKLDVDHENGGMTLDNNFLINFGALQNGPYLAHEMRFPGGDSSSDIWLADTSCKKK